MSEITPVKRPSMLITNLYLASRTGSELRVLEIATHFARAGWDVTCFTLIYGYPLQPLFEAEGIRVVTFAERAALDAHYDVLFAQQWRVSEYAWGNEGISFDHIVVSVLGIGKEERLPEFWHEADLLVFVSEDVRAWASERYDLENRATYVLPNYVSDEYSPVPARQLPARPHRGCCISNHVPAEVLDLVARGDEFGLELDVFGCGARSVEVTPALLASYDFVISIGRTVPCCLAVGTPAYCYDIVGGPGFITVDNWEQQAWYNFSGRPETSELTAEELAASIFGQWGGAVAGAGPLSSIVCGAFSKSRLLAGFEERVRELLQRTSDSKKVVHPFGHPDDVNRRLLACRDFLQAQSVFVGNRGALYAEGQIFYSCSGCEPVLSEERSRRFRYRLNSEVTIHLFDFDVPEGARIVRFDPADGPCAVSIACGEVLGHNACLLPGDGVYRFLTGDPQLTFEPCTQLAFCTFNLEMDALDQISSLMRVLSRQRAEQDALRDELELELETMRNRRAVRIADWCESLWGRLAGVWRGHGCC